MKLCRCPVCHSDINLDQLLEDDAGRELLTILTQLKYGVARPLVSYIALFRPAKSALNNARAVKLINDVLGMFPQSHLLAHCLSETVNAVQNKRREYKNSAPLVNHNYLKQVYETNKPHFSGVGERSTGEEQENKTTCQQIDKEKEDAILYIDRIYRLGQPVEKLEGYDIWKAWKEQQIGSK
ncbi:TPA: hypothetical protein RVS77_000038 [Pasteurella multocida]|uniref:hypothetical protein n=1 Tax=Pasteurella multocida TaxID=747 RepID=UPI0020254D23|nr:hypothetical protein [Pasteurella multocida]URJ96596.1 hypothetical protein M9413_07245 [Pasteurella multocida]HDR1038283.1 hypothetical protein [Pasteurella multocida]HDR1429421.1 hypothetical protein [Pasteurella multocida]HDV7288969.1 hypothetical protein [Pasteurella multocida]HEA3286481.1 hypothetical protein [Pasteurella multocida]